MLSFKANTNQAQFSTYARCPCAQKLTVEGTSKQSLHLLVHFSESCLGVVVLDAGADWV